MAAGIPARLTAAEGRKFAFTVAGAAAVFFAIAWWRGREIPAIAFGTLAGVLGLLGTVVPSHLTPLHRAWMGLGAAISKVTTPIFLGVLYFVVIAPSGLVMRLVGRDPLRHGGADGGFWVSRLPGGAGRGTMNNQF